MEIVIDRIIEELNLIKDRPYDEGGFSDEIGLTSDIWFGDPGVMAEEQYPFIFVEPVTSEPDSGTGTTQKFGRTLAIRIGLLIDPREFYESTELVEVTASREMIRAIESIERHFERTSLQKPGGLGGGTKGVVVGTTQYATQIRGTIYASGAQVTLNVDRQRPRLD